MSPRESYRVITVIRVNGTLDVVSVGVWVCMSQGWVWLGSVAYEDY